MERIGNPLIVSGTGHRPDKLGGWDNESAYRNLVIFASRNVLINGENGVVSGMAAGWDLALAEAAIYAGIPLMAVIPFEGQDARWTPFWRYRYSRVLEEATKVNVLETVNPNDRHAVTTALHNRNRWMVDYLIEKKGRLYALWNGDFRSGTGSCVRYAQKNNVDVVNFWDDWSNFSNGDT